MYIDQGYVVPRLNDATQAAANVTAIQAALNGAGKIRLVGSGVIYVNAPLVVFSNTELDIDKNLTIKQANGSNNNLLRSNAANLALSGGWTTLYNAGGSITTGPLSMIWSGSVTAWTQGVVVTGGTYKSANGNLYWCASGGTTAATGTGPSGTGSGIIDNTATWNYVTAYPASVSGAGNLTAILNWPSHGLSVGSAVWTTPQPDSGTNNQWTGTQAAGTRGGLADSAYFGTFYVAAVNDANFVTLTLRRVPAAAFSGIPMNVLVADQNISISGGGTLDYNTANQSPATSLATHAAILAGVMGLRVDGLNGINVAKFVLCLCGVSGFDIGHVQGGFTGTGSDQVKVYGPAFDGVVHDVYGTGGDDVVSLQTTEPTAFASYIIAAGDVIGVTVRQVSNVSGAGVSIIPDHQYLLMDNISVEKVTTHDSLASNRVSPIKITADVTGTPIIGTLKFKDIEQRDSDVPLFQIAGAGNFTVDHLLFENLQSGRNGTTGQLVALFASATSTIVFNNVEIRNSRGIAQSTGDTMATLNFATGGSLTVNRLLIDGCYFSSVTQGHGNVLSAVVNIAAIGTITLSNNVVSNLSAVISSIYIGEIELIGNRVTATNIGIGAFGTGATYRFARNRFSGVSGGVVRYNTTSAMTVYSDGSNTLVSGSVWFNYPQAANTNAFGWDIQLDVTKAVRAAGSYFYNTNAAPGSGTIAQAGPVMNDNTTSSGSFHLMAIPADTY